jgi:predicted GNAT superfamily acetyltransferase
MCLLRPYRDGMNLIDHIAITIDRDGFEALDRRTVDDLLAAASAAGASPVLREVFADDAEPAPVRERAFGLLAMQITSGRARSQFTLAA